MGADKPIVDTGRHGQVVRTQNNTTVKTWVVQVLEAPHAAIVCQALETVSILEVLDWCRAQGWWNRI